MQSHEIALRLRRPLEEVAHEEGARIAIVEAPPGPPVLATLTAEVTGEPGVAYGTLRAAARAVGRRLAREPGVADVDSTLEDDAERLVFVTDQEKAALSGVAVGRTSHRLRNPANAPEPWMVPLLDEFRAGPPQPDAWRSVDLGPRGTGYVEPIYLQPLCATCHGEAVEADLLGRIRTLYTGDEAVGFRVGELRGLFWAIVPGGGGGGSRGSDASGT